MGQLGRVAHAVQTHAILKAAIEAALKIMESRYWDMMYDPADLYHTAPKGPTSPTTPYGTWEDVINSSMRGGEIG